MGAPGWLWPATIVGLLAASATANVAFVIVATGDASFAVERDYYRKALEWDATRAQEARNAVLGWRLRADLVPAREGRAMELRAWLTSADGAPIEGATVTAEVFHNARAAQVTTAPLAARGGGMYGTVLPVARPGLWELRFTVMSNRRVFTATMIEELAAAGSTP